MEKAWRLSVLMGGGSGDDSGLRDGERPSPTQTRGEKRVGLHLVTLSGLRYIQVIRVRIRRSQATHKQAFRESGSKIPAVKPVNKLGKIQGTPSTSTAVIGSIKKGLGITNENFSLDGKSLRGSAHGMRKRSVHLPAGLLLHRTGQVVGPVHVDVKTNEIPMLQNLLDISGSTVTVDACIPKAKSPGMWSRQTGALCDGSQKTLTHTV